MNYTIILHDMLDYIGRNNILLATQTILLMFVFHSICILFNKFCNRYSKETKMKEHTIWFLLHFVGNMYVVYVSLERIALILKQPIYEIVNYTPYFDSLIVICAMHLYHTLFFKLTGEDIFHHISFPCVAGILSIYSTFGSYMALHSFAISGFPGGMVYLALFLENIGLISKETRQNIAVFMHVWIRAPILAFINFKSLLHFFESQKTPFNYFCLIFESYSCIFNGMFYMEQVVRSNEKLMNKKKFNKINDTRANTKSDMINDIINDIEINTKNDNGNNNSNKK